MTFKSDIQIYVIPATLFKNQEPIKFLEQSGANFGTGASGQWNSKTNTLSITNTALQLDVIEAALQNLDSGRRFK